MALAETTQTIKAIVYSDDYTVRQAVIDAVGKRVAHDLAPIEWDEAATAAGLQDKVSHNAYSIAVVDAEATKVSGMVVARTIAEEEDNVPVFVMLIARQQDEWLAEFSGAFNTVLRPLNPLRVQQAVEEAVRYALSRPVA